MLDLNRKVRHAVQDLAALKALKLTPEVLTPASQVMNSRLKVLNAAA